MLKQLDSPNSRNELSTEMGTLQLALHTACTYILSSGFIDFMQPACEIK